VIRLFDSDTWARLLHVENNKPVLEVRSFEIPEPEQTLDIDLGGQVRLLGYDLECKRGGAACHLTLYWQAQVRPEASFTVFAQLIDSTGQVRAQVDSVPLNGGYPTQWWLPGEIVADSITLELPDEADSQGAYRLITGMYDSATGNRLPVAGSGADYVDLTAIEP
jgi:hypothetical protein